MIHIESLIDKSLVLSESIKKSIKIDLNEVENQIDQLDYWCELCNNTGEGITSDSICRYYQ